jgi:hypothetical protein
MAPTRTAANEGNQPQDTIYVSATTNPLPSEERLLLEPILASQAYVYFVPTLPKAIKRDIISNGWVRCSCLLSVQNWRRDFPRPIGTPNNFHQVQPEPYIGAVIITKEGKVGHAGQVTSFTEDSITFRECNYTPCACGTRTLPRDSSVIRGYF